VSNVILTNISIKDNSTYLEDRVDLKMHQLYLLNYQDDLLNGASILVFIQFHFFDELWNARVVNQYAILSEIRTMLFCNIIRDTI